jgi:hypothetical protein
VRLDAHQDGPAVTGDLVQAQGHDEGTTPSVQPGQQPGSPAAGVGHPAANGGPAGDTGAQQDTQQDEGRTEADATGGGRGGEPALALRREVDGLSQGLPQLPVLGGEALVVAEQLVA